MLRSLVIFSVPFLLALTCQGQPFPGDTKLEGLRFYGVSLSSGYSTSAYPLTGQSVVPAVGAANLGSDINYAVTASAGFEHHLGGTDISIHYTPSYTGELRYSNLNAFGQSLLLAFTRQLTRKWTLAFSASGIDTTIDQYLYQPSTLSQISGMNANFNDVAAAFSAGQFSSPQAAAALTTIPAVQAAAQSALLGYQMLSYSGNVSLSYQFSPRWSAQVASFVSGGESRTKGESAVAQANYVMPLTVGANAGLSFNYELSPRTTLGFTLSANRVSNRYQRSTGGTGMASLGRKMGQHWFLRGYAGGSYVGSVTAAPGTAGQMQEIGGGSLGFRTYGNTWLGSYDRSTYSTIGLAVGRNTSVTGAWTWHRPGSGWIVQSSAGFIQMDGNGYAAVKGWQGLAGITRQLGSGFSIGANYVHLDTRGSYLGAVPTRLKLNSVRMVLSWSPQIGL